MPQVHIRFDDVEIWHGIVYIYIIIICRILDFNVEL